jgi:hypothetical protein
MPSLELAPKKAALLATAVAGAVAGMLCFFGYWEDRAREQADKIAGIRDRIERMAPETVCGNPGHLAREVRTAFDARVSATQDAISVGVWYGSGYARELKKLIDSADEAEKKANALYMRALEVPKTQCVKPEPQRG